MNITKVTEVLEQLIKKIEKTSLIPKFNIFVFIN